MSISIIVGSDFKSVGKVDLVLSTASFTFCFACATSIPELNSTTITEKSCTLLLFIFFTPLIDLMFFSIGRVIKFSISVGDVPGYIVFTIIVGITISGNCSFGIV